MTKREFLDTVFALAPNEANRIMDAFDKYVDSNEPHWTPCSKRMPEEREWIGTKQFGTTKSDEVYVTFENPKGERFCRHLSFQNGKVSGYDQRVIDVIYKRSKPIAWMPLPEPYKGVTGCYIRS